MPAYATRWTEGLKAECWYWGFAAGLWAFAATLDLKLFFSSYWGQALFCSGCLRRPFKRSRLATHFLVPCLTRRVKFPRCP